MDACRPHQRPAHQLPKRPGDSRAYSHRAGWCAAAVLPLMVAALIVAACSPEVRHRTLTFFFDGVPPLEVGIPHIEVQAPGDLLAGAALEPPERVEAMKRFYNHPPYKDNRCAGCHDVDAGGLLKTAREGLCQSCHPETPAKKKYVHGPVAVNGCLACHRYHRALHPKVLIDDAQTLCFHCHETGELRTDEHHATIEEEPCIDCHDAHGGDDRFFLIQKEETVDAS